MFLCRINRLLISYLISKQASETCFFKSVLVDSLIPCHLSCCLSLFFTDFSDLPMMLQEVGDLRFALSSLLRLQTQS